MKSLAPNDFVGMSFLVIFMSLAATTGFLVIERRNVKPKWKTPISTTAYYWYRSSTLLLYEKCMDSK